MMLIALSLLSAFAVRSAAAAPPALPLRLLAAAAVAAKCCVSAAWVAPAAMHTIARAMLPRQARRRNAPGIRGEARSIAIAAGAGLGLGVGG